jgi:hypothetical protein
MKTYLFDTDDFVLISYLKSKTPKKIWWSPIQYIFEYEDFYIGSEIYCCEKSPVLDNNYGYVMSVKFEKVSGKYTNINGCIVLTENRKISNIYIIRTLIYCHDYRNLKYAENIKYNFLGNFLSHPNEKLEEDIEFEKTNLVDVGLLINIEDDFIDAFVKDNNDDFYKFQEDYLLENFDFKHLPKEYEYIKFE